MTRTAPGPFWPAGSVLFSGPRASSSSIRCLPGSHCRSIWFDVTASGVSGGQVLPGLCAASSSSASASSSASLFFLVAFRPVHAVKVGNDQRVDPKELDQCFETVSESTADFEYA